MSWSHGNNGGGFKKNLELNGLSKRVIENIIGGLGQWTALVRFYYSQYDVDSISIEKYCRIVAEMQILIKLDIIPINIE